MKTSNYLFAMLLPFITKMATCGGMTDNFWPKESEEARETSNLLLFIPPNSLQMLHNNDNPPGDVEKNDGRESQHCGSSTRIDVSIHVMNSTFSVWNIEICAKEHSSVFFINESSISLSCCSMKYSAKRCIPPFAQTGGCLCCENISLTTSAAENGIPSLMASHLVGNILIQETSNRVSVSNSAFSSLQLLSSPFLSSSGKENVDLARSSFCNISIASAQTIRIPSSISESLNSISGCSFCEVCDVFYGGVIRSINTAGTTLCSFNNTYQRCKSNANANAYYSGESGRQVLTQSEIFEDDTFDKCISPKSGGAIFAVNKTLTITVRSNYYAGSLRLVKIFGADGKKVDPFSVDQCIFLQNRAGSCAGALLIENEIDASLLLKESSFQGNIAGRDGGAIQIHQLKSMQIDSSFVFMKFCFFDGNTARNGNGHDVYVIYPNLIDCPFELSFSTTEKQRVWFNGSQTEYDYWLGKGLLKRYVSSNGSDTELLCGESVDKPCKTIERAVRNSGYAMTQGVKLMTSIFAPLASIECGEKHIEVSGESHLNSIVRTQSLEVSSVLFCVSSGSLIITAIQIQHDSTAHPSPRLFVVSSSAGVLSLSDVLVLSSGSESGGSEIDASPFISNMHCFSLENVEIRNMVLSVPIFSEVELSSRSSPRIVNVTFENITRTTGSGSIFSCSLDSGSSFGLSNTTLKRCSCANGDGGGIHFSLQTGSELRVGDNSNVRFESCSSPTDESKKGKGGAMHLTCLNNECSFRIELCAFVGCDAWRGKNVFVEAQNLSKVISNASLEFHPQIGINATNFCELSGIERGNPEIIIPIALFLRAFQPPAHVSGKANGNDFRLCGFADYPCQTIKKAAEFRFPNSKRVVRLASSFGFDEEITLSEQSYEMDSSDKAIGLRVETTEPKEHDWLVKNNVTTALINITFELKQSISGRSTFVYSLAGDMRIIDCAIDGMDNANAIGYAFIRASGGYMQMLRLRCGAEREVLFGSNMVLVDGSAKCTIDQLTMNNVRASGSGGVIRMTTSNSVLIQNCSFGDCALQKSGMIHIEACLLLKLKNTSFGNVTRTTGDGACVSFQADEVSRFVVDIENCSLKGCRVTGNGNGGGGMCAVLRKTSELYVSSTTFEECRAPSESGTNGQGGGMLLHLLDSEARFELSETLGFILNEAEHGANLFVLSPDLATSVRKEQILFPILISDLSTLAMGIDSKCGDLIIPLKYYLADDPEAMFMSNSGVDVVVCGFEEFRCKTVDYALQRVMGKERKVRFGETYLFSENVILNESEGYEFCGVATRTRMEMKGNETGSECVIVVFSRVKFELFVLVLHGSLQSTQTSMFQVSGADGELQIKDCGIECEPSVIQCNYSFIRLQSGSLSVAGLRIETVQFASAPILCLKGNGKALINSVFISDVQMIDANGLIEYTSENLLSLTNVTAQSCSNRNCGFISDREGRDLSITNSSLQGVNNLEGNGSVVNGMIGNECKMSIYDVKIEGCGASKGCGGGISVVLKGTGVMRMGIVEYETYFGKCSASGEGPVGGIDVDKNPDLRDLMGMENENIGQLIPLVVLFREKPTVGYVHGRGGGMDYDKCGYFDFPCSTLKYAGKALFGTSLAVLRLLSSFSIEEEIVVDSQAMIIDGEMQMQRVVVNELGEGEREKENMIETMQNVKFNNLAFVVSRFAESTKESVFLCSGNILRIEGCSFATKEGIVEATCICCRGGKIEMVKCEFGNFETLRKGMIVIDGVGVEGLVDEVTIRNSTREGGGSVVELKRGKEVVIANSTLKETDFADGNMILVGNGEEGCGTSLTMRNNTFLEITRNNGNGGVMNGDVRNRECIEITNCTFEKCGCEADGSMGGGMVMIVREGGRFVYERNKMDKCTVPSGSGKGGGLYVRFESMNITYSMKNNEFRNSVAEKGDDVYLVCESPWLMLLPTLWYGTATNATVQKLMWVEELSDASKEGSIISYLFPSLGSYMFVDGTGNDGQNCGLKENPCLSVDVGFARMKDEHVIMQLEGDAEVNGKINRDGKSLTIQGNDESQKMVVGEEGKFEQTEGEALTYLIFSVLEFVLPRASMNLAEEQSVVEVRVGQCTFVDCSFSGCGNAQNECGKWIVAVKGGFVHFDRAMMKGVHFAGSGIALCSGGSTAFENCTIDDMHTNGVGLVMNEAGSDVSLQNSTVMKCIVGLSSFLVSKRGAKLSINEESSFEDVQTESMRGGCIRCELGMNDQVNVEAVSFMKCAADENEGRGGGVYLDVLDDSENNIKFSEVQFKGNQAFEGKDLFVSCKKLNETVTSARFGFEYEDEEGVFVDMKGRDRDRFEESVDLRLFLVERKAEEVYVSSEGYDAAGCGSEIFPCCSVWSGINHIGGNEVGLEKRLVVMGESRIEDCFMFDEEMAFDGHANEEEEVKWKLIHFASSTTGSGMTSVIASSNSLSLLSLKLEIPSLFEAKLVSLILSSGKLRFENCTFAAIVTDVVEYSLVKTTNGTCSMIGCSLQCCLFAISPFIVSSSMELERCNFSQIENTGGNEGGVMNVILKEEEYVAIKDIYASVCSLSADRSRGGFFFLNCQNCSSSNSMHLLLDVGVKFDKNRADIGKNVFILAADLNNTVRTEIFRFDYESMKEDGLLFVGSDNIHSDKDLFMFLVPYGSFEIFISSNGFDVARCGSKREPCRTLWKGMKNMKDGEEMKTIQIEGSSSIRDSFNASNYQFEKSETMGEENEKAVLFLEKAVEDGLNCYLANHKFLSFTGIALHLRTRVDNACKTAVVNRAGKLEMTGCSFRSDAQQSTPSRCVFVAMGAGELVVKDLLMDSSSVGSSVFVINEVGVACTMESVHCSSLNETEGCVFTVKETEEQMHTKNGKEMSSILFENCSFVGMKRSDDGASVCEMKGESGIELRIEDSLFVDNKAEASEKGGVMLFVLSGLGALRISKSTISRCCCSESGKGGGVYLRSRETGRLDFVFEKMNWSANTAGVGNDIFVECYNITSQINETQFHFDLREKYYVQLNAIYGIDVTEHTGDTNLIDFITIHQSDTIVVSSENGSNERQCGTYTLPCYSIDYGLMHLTSEFMSLVFVDGASVINGELQLEEMSLSSRGRELCHVEVCSSIKCSRQALIETTGAMSITRLKFVFESGFASSHSFLLFPEGGLLEVTNCTFSTKITEGMGERVQSSIPFCIVRIERGECMLEGCVVSDLSLSASAVCMLQSAILSLISCDFFDLRMGTSLIDAVEGEQLGIEKMSATNITSTDNSASLISCLKARKLAQLTNCSLRNVLVTNREGKGKCISVKESANTMIESCIFDGNTYEREFMKERFLNENDNENEICKWNGSTLEAISCNMKMKDTTITNTPEGGLAISGGSVEIEDGKFDNNNPSIEGYPSLRRNIICSDSGTLNVLSLKGGDGVLPNTSLWMLNDGCSFEGIASERDSSFFIPKLESVEGKEETGRMKLTFKGMILIPCNLSFSVVKRNGEEKEIEKHDFDSNGFLSEKEVEGSVGKDLISSCGDEIEVSVYILFGNAESPSSTQPFILKNASETKENGNERIVEGGREQKSFWPIIVIIMAIILMIVLIVSVVLAVRWRKQKRRTEELEIIVEDTVRKDPKLIEMVTMEMSPEEQWRRAEREAEKKNEEKIKKRVYAKSLEHSESSEHLLSESGSTEYILGKDSDKIPDWALEKEEEEEIRKQTPSPSISSTSTTDSDSTFVRGEDLCPTTSSMSNLVDAIACSSPHEKLIVDLRDSLFMLLHGRNEKKEMAIGSLKERVMTAAQVLFWVANGAIHSFDEMENPLQSLSSLSPHIVLFSEHMVICIVVHSDLLSDDSDSSSISSSTVVTSASDDEEEEDSLPSSAFEDENDFKKECLRWKAPELLMNKKMGATKKSVVFSIGMMAWECLTLQIPFGEYEAEVAGQKIANGERPEPEEIEGCELSKGVKACLSQNGEERPGLMDVKRELFGHFPAGAVMVTVTDAIGLEVGSGDRDGSGDSEAESGDSLIR
ncbi:uncharacterized protein MONOS_575 [Monocercomonoides exilis]|uniref:uncharacterized protein n=1 Tax=Monocercomonoides exilis TaxID=2049356 RepID=UPI00355A5BFD|nr:hypothetical protein MONOS_575 [Monocercomonoides exilis]|eukprot:MONOS_575.1-p1 / transcript=MONOS_575.1 / gene=MONOS_575 / organism=Monocercomonoides_exilis_PA203 / gene_product=unspecified product / transcript_product=unspecified product / location=Mono_scaffold00009:102976-115441(-) / protein_length=3981 / sequence_SO=supercontig / SO=protein_coding / is_pseudo=false